MPVSTRCKRFVAVLGLCLSSAAAHGQSNTCATATTANLGANPGTVVGATNDGASTCGVAGGRDVYFKFTPATTGAYELSLCQDDVFWDSVMSVHTGCPATGANTLACDDDGCNYYADLSAIPNITLNAGVPYTIRIAGYGAGTPVDTIILNINAIISGACCDGPCCLITSSSGCTGLFLGADTLCTPEVCGTTVANDDCAGAIEFLDVPSVNVAGSTFLACTTVGSGANCGAGGVNDVWYKFRPSVSANFTADVCSSGFPWDSVISVHTACPGNAGNQIAATACNDDNCTGGIGLSAITTPFALTAGTDYYIRVAGYVTSDFGPNRGDFILNVTSEPLGGCCSPSGTCSVTASAPCTAPNTWLSGATCVPNPCPQPVGACCDANTGACTSVLDVNCLGSFQGVGTTCSPNPCAQPMGACCGAGGICSEVLGSGACTGTFQGAGTTCSPSPCPAAPTNDACLMATMASTGSNVGTLIAASSDGLCSCEGGGGVDVYFTFTPGTTGTYEISLCQDVVFFDSILSVHSGCPATDANELACDDDGCGFLFDLSQIDAVPLTAGTPYIIRVATYDDLTEGDTFDLRITQVISGACCFADGLCELSTEASCFGVFQGDNSTCDVNPCPQPGACCSGSGCCTFVISANCTSGTFQGEGIVCSPNPCGAAPANDACSGATVVSVGVPATGTTCLATTNEGGLGGACALGGAVNTYRGVWFSFTAPATAAYRVSACGSDHDTVLSMFTTPDCVNFTEVPGACDDDTCDGVTPPGNGLASEIASVVLNAGSQYYILLQSWGLGAEPVGGAYALNVTSVAVLGSCCNGSVCTQTDAANCGGVFTAAGACSPNPCATSEGACCCGSHCFIAAEAACTGANTSFAGNGSACEPFSNSVPCCRGDYNKSGGGPSVQDIFDFLGGYFSNDTCADANDSGGIPSVQDIFDFLGAYFSGPC